MPQLLVDNIAPNIFLWYWQGNVV